MRHHHAVFATVDRGDGGISRALLLTAMIALLAADGVLLLPFLGMTAAATSIASLGAAGATAATYRLARVGGVHIPARRAAICLGIALILLLLGGEGGLFYPNPDWQVRNAVLQDMTVYPWPFAYDVGGGEAVMRAPIGMYLLPALLAKAFGGAHAGLFLLLQNSLFLGSLLTLGSSLFEDRRSRLIAATVAIGFSGMDALGTLFREPALLTSIDAHLEAWARLQFSSAVTILFWAPQHGLSGWSAALLFLLWKKRAIPLSLLMAPMPLLALWSPFGVVGALPFVAIAGATTLVTGKLKPIDIVMPLAITLLALPSLIYLSAGSGAVGMRIVTPDLQSYCLIESIEVAPLLLCLWGTRRFAMEKIELATIASVLIIVPVIWIGRNCDFMMRASIPALAILAISCAEQLAREKRWRAVLAGMLMIGAITPLHEIARAILYQPAPAIHCTLIKAFNQSYAEQGLSQYLAPPRGLPAPFRSDHYFPVPQADDGPCWDRPWAVPR